MEQNDLGQTLFMQIRENRAYKVILSTYEVRWSSGYRASARALLTAQSTSRLERVHNLEETVVWECSRPLLLIGFLTARARASHVMS
ncbi:hypothetical protein EVAR_32439_1 [Eumeta japonica]|uniref:Uncharacterized protein n=1 Tax=Eumeta variegata TaxID=151549 RepID=A0A4C1VKJ6_EUMVA|nr:hypothetical protein EVAR_32439_1 [Eumeta japonica]